MYTKEPLSYWFKSMNQDKNTLSYSADSTEGDVFNSSQTPREKKAVKFTHSKSHIPIKEFFKSSRFNVTVWCVCVCIVAAAFILAF